MCTHCVLLTIPFIDTTVNFVYTLCCEEHSLLCFSVVHGECVWEVNCRMGSQVTGDPPAPPHCCSQECFPMLHLPLLGEVCWLAFLFPHSHPHTLANGSKYILMLFREFVVNYETLISHLDFWSGTLLFLDLSILLLSFLTFH